MCLIKVIAIGYLNDIKAFNFSNILYNLNKHAIVIEILFDHSYAMVRYIYKKLHIALICIANY